MESLPCERAMCDGPVFGRGFELDPAIQRSSRCATGLAALSEGKNVVQLLRTGFKKPADIAGRLPNALLVFDVRDAQVAFSMFSKRSPGGDWNCRLLDQDRGDLHAAEALKHLGNGRPGEHGGARRRNFPAGSAERFDQDVAA